jgi:hypothetical protein
MSITTYSELKTAVANWLARSDLTDYIPDFITLFEAVANRRLRVRQMETTTTLTTSSGSVALPSDFQTWRRMGFASGSRTSEVEYVTPNYLYSAYPTSTADTPKLWTIVGSNIITRPYDDTASALTLDYYQTITALSDAAPTNWLLTKWPDVYLFGALAEASGFIKKFDDLAMWGSRREGLFNEIEMADAKVRGPSSIKIIGATP